MLFKEIPGNEEVATRLIRGVQEQRVSHAQLFAGAEGTGKLAMAIAYAQYINCKERTEADSCGVCPSCIKHSQLIHPDLHFVFPIVKGKKQSDPDCDNYIAEWRQQCISRPFFSINDWMDKIDVLNAQAIIYAAEASEIIRKLSLKTYEAEYKVMIIWLPEKMHITAANKLLKMIEEPPDKTVFILISEEPGKVIPTIMSRCQIVKFTSIENRAVASWLTKNYSLTDQNAEETARIANGNLVRATALAENSDETADDLDSFRSLMRIAWMRDIESMVNWTDEMAATGRERLKEFLGYSLSIIRGNYMMNSRKGDAGISFMTSKEETFSSKFYPFVNRNNIDRLYHYFNEAYSHIEANGNAKIVLMDMALRISEAIKR